MLKKFLSLFFITVICLFCIACVSERKYELYKVVLSKDEVVLEEYEKGNFPAEFDDFVMNEFILHKNYSVTAVGENDNKVFWRETSDYVKFINDQTDYLILKKQDEFLVYEEEIDGYLYQAFYRQI